MSSKIFGVLINICNAVVCFNYDKAASEKQEALEIPNCLKETAWVEL